MKEHSLGLFVFRRDLRLEDNTALLSALESCDQLIPCFIFDSRQIGSENEYRGDFLIQFMLKSLEELHEALSKRGSQLYCFSGVAEEVLPKIIKTSKADAVFWNKDYTPFSKKRDKKIKAALGDVECCSEHDALLTIPGEVLTQDGKPYKVFTPFMREAKRSQVAEPRKNNFKNFYKGTIAGSDIGLIEKYKSQLEGDAFRHGGRSEALGILKNIASFKNYKEERDIPKEAATTGLSAHNKFGTVSIREVYHAVREAFSTNHELISELYWRDFFHHVAAQFPHVFGSAFNEKYNDLRWNRSKKDFTAWCEGNTGFPIVDAGMRELNATGFMHNRVRMITASFLVKDLHIDWRWGEKYFAQKLVDYDPCVNNGNWQWAASTGCDAQPYFRIFNPWRQIERFDPECAYIKKWIPELSECSAKEIKGLEKGKTLMSAKYPDPIVDHKEAAAEAKRMYGEL